METIASFQINHDKLDRGLYVSRIDGDCVTYDVRICQPNKGVYMQNGGIHTMEHLLATYLRSSDRGKEVVYVGPMGCRTGFYIILRDSVSRAEAITLIRDAFQHVSDFVGAIPGASRVECGNYLNHDLSMAKAYARIIVKELQSWTTERMDYPE